MGDCALCAGRTSVALRAGHCLNLRVIAVPVDLTLRNPPIELLELGLDR